MYWQSTDCPPLCCGRTAPEVSEEGGSYASGFYPWLLESFKSCLLLLVALPGLIDTLAQLLAWRSLLWLSMTWRRGYLTQSNFLSTTSLPWSLALHFLFSFSQEKPLPWKEKDLDQVILGTEILGYEVFQCKTKQISEEDELYPAKWK